MMIRIQGTAAAATAAVLSLILVKGLAAPPEPLVPARLSLATYEDKVKAAWLGQIIGALMGMPFEHRPSSVKFVDTIGPNEIAKMKEAGNGKAVAYVDDDYYYEIVALRAFEKYGIGMTVEQLGRQWVENSAGAFASSEYTRLLLARGIRPPDTGHPRYNPLWYTIGPQFSADIYGMLAPGMPNVAGKLAREMGHINGYAEGADGGVFVAGMVSQAFVENIPQNVVRSAARLIHPSSPYRQAVDMVIRMAEAGHSADEIALAIEDRYRVDYPATNNAVPNGAIVALSVWFGDGDYLKTVNVAFRAGDFTDADCNAANAGAVVGAMGGMTSLPARLVEQVHDSVRGSTLGVPLTPPVDESITDLAKRTAAIGRKILLAHGARPENQSLLVPLEPVKTQEPEVFRTADLMQYWNPDWKLERAGVGGASGGWKGLRVLGMTYLDGDVLVTNPRDRVRGVVLRRTVKLGASPYLEIEAGAEPDRAWELLVYADNTLLLSQRIEGKGRGLTWVPVRAGLEAFAGQEVTLRIFQTHKVRDYTPGNGYWKSIRLKRSASSQGQHHRHVSPS